MNFYDFKFVFYLAISWCNLLEVDGITVAEQLKDVLMEGYDSSIRPVNNERDILIINISMNTMSVLTLDPAEETINFSSEFILQWKDEFLFWNKSDYNITWLKLKESFLWTPDTTVSTSIDTNYLIDASERYVSVKHDGTVRQSIYAVFTNLCDMNVDKFPYDQQTCMIKMGPWSYTTQEVTCIVGRDIAPNDTDFGDFHGNSEWDFEGIVSSVGETEDPDVNFTFSEVHFALTVKRRPQFYVWVLLIPTYIITVVCIFGLFTPTANHGLREERVNLGITTLLSSAVILQIVANAMPKTSELPLLGNFILAEIFVVAIGVLFAVLVLTLHQRAHTREWRPPAWMLWILRMTGSSKFLSRNITKIRHKSSTAERIHYTGEGAYLFKNLDESLQSVREYIQEEDRDYFRELTYVKFFDRLDFLLLFIFQVGNALVTLFLVKQ
ncbi:Ligand-Gated ion Channel [Caenorhabditis elegans]|uniref:Ligand-Gated ion Channel n=1 Tax=Caenorhabditis elegans TaxID=6239 RepID=O18228_CAEEL|nr:Ligand-Gated ion Channel [Caenorhabditis elegans]CAB16504.2 Ligand-Gated ion Channel [Caenorhabditis elegans]|eukprot:NP_502777.2 Ligand-Gated ion Channel [Caenorhabditis elegans]